MQSKRISKIIAFVIGTVMILQSFGGVSVFASSGESKETSQLPTVYSTEQKETSSKTEADSTPAPAAAPKPAAAEEKASGEAKPEAKEEAKADATPPVGEASGEAALPTPTEGEKTEGEAAKPEGESATPVATPVTETPQVPAVPSGAPASEGEEEAEEYKVTIDDPYVKEIAEATEEQRQVFKAVLGMSNIDDYTMFTVTYKAESVEDSAATEPTDPEAEIADGDTEVETEGLDNDGIVTVKDGDMVPKGTKLTIVAKPMIGPMTVTINDEQHPTPMGRLQETTIEYTAESDVAISARSGLSMLALPNGQGTAVKTIDIDAVIGTTVNGVTFTNAQHVVNEALKPSGALGTHSTTVTYYKYVDSDSSGNWNSGEPRQYFSNTYYLTYGSFVFTYSGTNNLTVDMGTGTNTESKLGKRSISFGGTGNYTVNFKNTTSGLGAGGATVGINTYSGYYSTNASDYTTAFAAMSADTALPNTTITFSGNAKISTVEINSTATSLSNPTHVDVATKNTITGTGTIDLQNSGTVTHDSLIVSSTTVGVKLAQSGGHFTLKTDKNIELNDVTFTGANLASDTFVIEGGIGGTAAADSVGSAPASPSTKSVILTELDVTKYKTIKGGQIVLDDNTNTTITDQISGDSLTVQGGLTTTANGGANLTGALDVAATLIGDASGVKQDIIAGGAVTVAGTLTGNNISGYSMSVSGTEDVYGNLTVTNGHLSITATGTVDMKTASKNITISGGLRIADGGTLTANGATVAANGTSPNHSIIDGDINNATNFYGHITVNSTAGGTIDNVYGKGYVSLNAVGVTYQNVFGAGASAPTQATYTGDVTMVVAAGKIDGKLYGGGNGTAAGTVNFTISGGSINQNPIYGGSLNAATANTNLTVGGFDYTTYTNAKTIYGGGHAETTVATVTGDSNVIINPSGVNYAAVYGGGHAAGGTANVGLQSSVLINANVTGNVYGGGHAPAPASHSATTGSTSVTNTTPTTATVADVYGGGFASAGGIATTGNTSIALTAGTAGNVHGGGHSTGTGEAKAGATTVSLTGSIMVTESVYGGGHTTAGGNSDVSSVASLNVGVAVPSGSVYGGGHNTGTGSANVTNNITNTTISGAVSGSVYGGGNTTGSGTATVGGSITTAVSGAVTKSVYGGGHSAAAGSANVTGTITTTVSSNVDDDIYGGGHSAAAAAGSATAGDITLTVRNTTTTNSIYGGGHTVSGNSVNAGIVNLTVGSVSVSEDIYGGGHTTGAGTADVAKVTLKAGTFAVAVGNDLYGGGHTTDAGSANVAGVIDLDLDGTYNGNVYGGGFADGVATGDAKATDIILKINSGTVGASVYGGGHTKGTGIVSVGNVTSTLGATGLVAVTANVYGGGHSTSTGAATAGDIILLIKNANAVNVYGGGISATGDTKVNSTQVTTELGTISGSLYGGGTGILAPVTNGTIVKIGSIVNNSVFGGGDGNIIGTTTNVTITGTVDKDVYGGGNGANKLATVGQTTTTTLDAGQVKGNVYGGGFGGAAGAGDVLSTANPASTVKIINAGKVGVTVTPTNLYGGGNGAAIKGGTRVEFDGDINNYVYGSVYGGGIGTNARVELDSSVFVDAGTVGINLHGGGVDNPVNGKVDITIKENGTVLGSLFGGGTGTAAPIGKHVTIDVNGKIDGDLYGGGENNPVNNSGTEAFAVYILLGEKAVTNSTTGDVYGGAKAATVNGNVKIDTRSKSKVKGNLYGGGNGDAAKTDSTVKGYTLLNVNGSVDKTVYGGGISSAPIDKYTIVNIIAGSTNDIIGEDVYGGGADDTSPIKHYDGNIATHNGVGNSTTTTINGYVLGNVYGGSRKSKIIANTAVFVKGGKVTGSVYGASHDEAGFDTDIDGTTYVEITGGTIDGTGNQGAVFGGGSAGSEVLNKVPSTDIAREFAAKVFIKGADVVINSHVYGGGEFAETKTSPVHGPTHVDMQQGIVNGNVYGGGYDSLIEGYTKVEIGPLNANDICTVDGIVFGGGNGSLAIIEHIRGTDVLIRQYATVGSVYGGGENDAHITGTKGTGAEGQRGTKVDIYGKVLTSVFGGGLKANVDAPAIDGTFVTIHSVGEVGEDVFGGGYEGDVYSDNTTDVYIYGTVKRNVYGGGFDGDVTKDRGPYVTVSREASADNSGFVGNDVYGGGYGYNKAGQAQQTHVLVEQDSTVQHSVFGGGRGPGQARLLPGLGKVFKTTDVKVTGQYTVIGKRDKTATLFVESNPFTRCKDFMFRGETELDENVIGDTVKLACSTKWMDVGNIYGGGSWAEVGSDTSVNIYDMDQKAFNRVSGGNLGIVSTNTVRKVDITNLGVGVTGARAEGEVIDELNNTKFYSSLDVYTAIRFMQDYSTTNTNTSHLTIYYNLKTTDDGVSVHGIHNTHASEHIVNDGNYHSWRPKEHTAVIVEPKVTFNDNAKLRIEANYAVDFKDGAFSGNMTRVTLLMDPALDKDFGFTRPYHDGSTSKIYGPDNIIKEQNLFSYEELLRMLVPTNLQDRNSSGVVGVSFYIPPIEIRSLGVEDTNWGGTSKQDLGGTYEIVINQEELDGIAKDQFKLGGDTKAHYTDPKAVASLNALVAKAQAVIKTDSKVKAFNISERKAGQVSTNSLIAVAKEAAKTGATITYRGDTHNDSANVEGRMYIDTSKAKTANAVINTGVHTCAKETAFTVGVFKNFFRNKTAVISLDQKDSFGMTVKIAAKVDLADLDQEKLMFYAYSPELNKFTQIKQANYTIDSNGYVHFYTDLAGDIVITDSAIKLK